MMEELRLVVLIDGENMPCDCAEDIFREAAAHGEAVVRKVYLPRGDTTWKNEVLHRHAIEPIFKIPYATKKNVIDIALVLDAMDFMHRGRSIYDGFCIASNDSDFSPLAMRLREEGFKVIGFGDKRALDSFVQSCNQFIRLTKDGDKDQDSNTKPAESTASGKEETISATVAAVSEPIKDTPDATKMLLTAIQRIGQVSKSEWVALSTLGAYLQKIDPSFDVVRIYGCKLKKLVERNNHLFEIREENGHPYVREKSEDEE